MENEILNILDYEVSEYPKRSTGEDGYEYINKIAAKYISSNRNLLISALSVWIDLRSEPKTMLAVDIAGRLNLFELREEIEMLLDEVERGKTFMKFYERPIKLALGKFCV